MNKKWKRFTCGLLTALLLAALLPAYASNDSDALKWDRRLYELGYRDSNANGELDEATVIALINFQRANDLEETGEFDDKTVSLLMSEAAKSEREYLSEHAYAYTDESTLARGSYGDQVQKLQEALTKFHYFSDECDGSYGDATEAAVYRFQLANGLAETGIADGLVQLRLYEGEPADYEVFLEESCAQPGDSGTDVRRLQLRLKNLGFFSGKCTGRYGDGTQQAVKDFQALNGMEVSGNADRDTCRRLYSSRAEKNENAYTVYRGNTDEDTAEICRVLAVLGYPADSDFDAKTEMAVCEFQIVNGIDVTGAVNPEMRALLDSPDALMFNPEEWTFEELNYTAEMRDQAVKMAMGMLGKSLEIDSSFEFIQYILLKCGVALMHEPQLQLMELTEDALPGQILLVQTDDYVCYGIAAADGAFIYRNDEGFVVMGYLNAIETRAVYAWRIGETDES